MATKEQNLIIAKITTKNQITIPKSIRQKLDVHSHDELAFELQDDGNIVIKKNAKVEDFWNQVARQTEQYGSYEDSEIDWGADVGNEEIDW